MSESKDERVKVSLPVGSEHSLLTQSTELDINAITNKLMTSDEHLRMKTQIVDAVGMSVLSLLALDAKSEFGEGNELQKLYEALEKRLCEYNPSVGGKRADMIKDILIAGSGSYGWDGTGGTAPSLAISPVWAGTYSSMHDNTKGYWYVNLGDGVDELTIGAWVNPDSGSGDAGLFGLILNGSDTYYISVNLISPSDYRTSIAFYNDSSHSSTDDYYGIPYDEWTYIYAVFTKVHVNRTDVDVYYGGVLRQSYICVMENMDWDAVFCHNIATHSSGFDVYIDNFNVVGGGSALDNYDDGSGGTDSEGTDGSGDDDDWAEVPSYLTVLVLFSVLGMPSLILGIAGAKGGWGLQGMLFGGFLGLAIGVCVGLIPFWMVFVMVLFLCLFLFSMVKRSS